MIQNKIIFIVGPTASGKTAISLEVARCFSAEVISCDSMQVYRGMNIGTDTISPALQREIPHHMIDMCDPCQVYSAFDYRKDALSAIRDVFSRSHMPLVVGGSGLYMKALCDGLSRLPAASNTIRESLGHMRAEKGLDFLYAQLRMLCPERAEKIHPHDERRIVRALEILYQTGERPAEDGCENKSLIDLGYSYEIIGLNRSRQELYARVNARVDTMIENGLIDEVRQLKGSLSQTTSHAVGYKEIIAYLDGALSRDQAIELIKKNSRNLVKKQMTWFNKDRRIKWIELSDQIPFAETVKEVYELIDTFIKVQDV